MKFLPLLWSSLWRKKVRTIFTLLSIFVAFLLFGLLMTIRTAFSFGVEIAGHRSARADPQGQPDHAAADLLSGPAAHDRGRDDGHAQLVVRRRLSGSLELLRADRHRARTVHEAVSRVPSAAGSDEGLARGPAGRDRRRRSGEALQLEDRRSRPAGRHDLAAEERPGLGIQRRRPLRRRSRRGQDAVLLPLRLSQREPARAATDSSAGTSSRSRMRRRRSRWARSSMRCSPTRRRRRRRRPRRASSRASPSRSATSARS